MISWCSFKSANSPKLVSGHFNTTISCQYCRFLKKSAWH